MMKRFFVFCMIMKIASCPAVADEIVHSFTGDVTIEQVDKNIQYRGEHVKIYNYPGRPELPYRVFTFILPQDADLESVSVSLRRVQKKAVNVWPAAAGSQRFFRDTEIFAEQKSLTGDIFPDRLVGDIHTGQMRSFKLVSVSVFLCRLYPGTKKVFTLETGDVVVQFERRADFFPGRQGVQQTPDPIGLKYLQNKAVNYVQGLSFYRSGAAGIEETGQTGYAILTTNDIVDRSTVLDDFIASKQQRGFQVYLITEDQWGAGTGDTAADNIRLWLKREYLSKNLEYVLLIGNPHARLGEVPMKMLWPRKNESIHKESPSDFYYADLTGNWDINANGFCGEYPQDFGPGGVDVHWDVVVGRIPFYNDYDELDHILRKIIDYENTPVEDIGWRKNILLAMEPLDKWTPGYQLGEQIKDYILSPDGTWLYSRIYENDYDLTQPPEFTPCNIQNVNNTWNNSPFGAALWSTNGTHDKAYDVMDIPHARQLNDSLPAFTFQCTCYNAYPETALNLSYEMLKNGAIASIGATRVSWYARNLQNFNGVATNRGMAFEFFKRLAREEMSCGYALEDLRQQLHFWLNEDWMNLVTFNLYGDPSLSVRTCKSTRVATLELHVENGTIRTSDGEAVSGTTAIDFEQGAAVQLYAETDPGYVFSHWSGVQDQLKKNPCLIVMEKDRSVQAHYIEGVKAAHVCVAAVKYPSALDVDINFELLLNRIKAAVQLDRVPDLLVLPEYSLVKEGTGAIEFIYDGVNKKYNIAPGYENHPVTVALDSISNLAERYSTNVVAGTLLEENGNDLYESALVMDNYGDIIGLRRKYAASGAAFLQSLGAYTLKTHRDTYFSIFPVLGEDAFTDSSWSNVAGLDADILVLCEKSGQIDYLGLTRDIYNQPFDPTTPDWQEKIQDIYIRHYIDDNHIVKALDGYLVVADGADTSAGIINLNPAPQLPGILRDTQPALFGLLELVPAVDVSYEFPQAGWYLLSLPGTAKNMNVDVLFPAAVSGKVLTFENNKYVAVEKLEPGKGYWVFFSQPCSTVIPLRPVRHFSRHIAQPGWALLGSVFDPIEFKRPRVTPRGSIALPVKYFDSLQQRYIDSEQLLPTVGYWIVNYNACTLSTGPDSVLLKSAKIRETAEPPAPPSMADILPESVVVPEHFRFRQNYPNPFNPETLIQYHLAEPCFVKIQVFNIKGESVKTLENRPRTAGRYKVLWNGRNDLDEPVPSGLYFIHMKAGRHSKTIKATLVK